MLFPFGPCPSVFACPTQQPRAAFNWRGEGIKLKGSWTFESFKLSHPHMEGTGLTNADFLKILSRYRVWQVQPACCDNDFFLPRHSVKQMLSSCERRYSKVYICIYKNREEGTEREKEERNVLCLDVRRAPFHERLLESAAGKIIKGLALVFLEHLVQKTECLICFLCTDCLNSWMPLSIATNTRGIKASGQEAHKRRQKDSRMGEAERRGLRLFKTHTDSG